MLCLGVRPPKSPLLVGQGPPCNTVCYWTPQVYLPNGIWIRRTVSAGCMKVTDDRQTDHATEKCLGIGGIACAVTAIPHFVGKHICYFWLFLSEGLVCVKFNLWHACKHDKWVHGEQIPRRYKIVIDHINKSSPWKAISVECVSKCAIQLFPPSTVFVAFSSSKSLVHL